MLHLEASLGHPQTPATWSKVKSIEKTSRDWADELTRNPPNPTEFQRLFWGKAIEGSPIEARAEGGDRRSRSGRGVRGIERASRSAEAAGSQGGGGDELAVGFGRGGVSLLFMGTLYLLGASLAGLLRQAPRVPVVSHIQAFTRWIRLDQNWQKGYGSADLVWSRK